MWKYDLHASTETYIALLQAANQLCDGCESVEIIGFGWGARGGEGEAVNLF